MKDLIKRLTSSRAQTYKDAEALLSAVEARGTDFTKAEKAEWDALNTEMDVKDERIKELNETTARNADYDAQRAPLEDVVRPRYRGDSDSTAHRAGQWLASELRDLTGSGVSGGGSFTPSESKKFFFDILFAKSVGFRSGFRVISTARDSVIVPRLTADAASGWYAEGATFTETDPTADQVTATPSKLAAITALSNEVIADSDPAILDVVGQSLIRSLALKFDLGAFTGTGTPPEVRGLKNTTGVQTVSMGVNGAALTNLDPFADALGQLETENAEGTAIVMHPREWKTLSKIKEVTGSTKPVLQESSGAGSQGIERKIYGVPVYLSSQLPITEVQGTSGAVASSAYVYEAAQVVAVIRQDTRVEKDSSRLFNSDKSELRAIMRADVVVPNPKAVCRIVGII